MVHSSDFNQMEKSCQRKLVEESPWVFLCFDLKMFDKHFAVGAKHFTKHSITSWKKSFWAKGWLQILHSFHRTFHQTFHFELISFSFYIWPKLIIWWPKVCLETWIKIVENQKRSSNSPQWSIKPGQERDVCHKNIPHRAQAFGETCSF